jgi:hypothetical protein
MPSAKCSFRPGLYARIAREVTGVGVTPSPSLNNGFHTVTAGTSGAVHWAGADSACVSLPKHYIAGHLCRGNRKSLG